MLETNLTVSNTTFDNNSFLEDEEEFEEEEEGAGLSITTILTPKLIIALTAIVLNLGVVIYFIKKRKQMRLSEFMLLSLAAADLLFTTLTLADIMVFYVEDKYEIDTEIVAIIGRQLIWFSIYSSIFHILAISFDRLAAVMNPFKYKIMINKTSNQMAHMDTNSSDARCSSHLPV